MADVNKSGWIKGLFSGLAGIVVVVIAAFWIVALMDKVVMPFIVQSGNEIEVPDLHHLSFEEAEKLCEKGQIELIRGKERIDEFLPVNSILDQYPVAGLTVKPGRRVEVVVSTHALRISCPDLFGRSPREAKIIANSSGLVIPKNKIHYRYSSRFPEGVVLSQKPAAGTEIDRGDTLSIGVSLGAKPDKIVVPDVVGQNLEGINIVLAKHNLRLGKVTKHPTSASVAGTILAQDPLPGITLQKSVRVNVSVAVKPVKDR